MIEPGSKMKRFNRGFVYDPKLEKERRERRQFKSARLIVRNLPFSSTEDSVKEHFSQFGNVAEVKLLRKGDKLVGCGFVQFDSKVNAAIAIKKTSGNKFKGRVIIVDWAIPKNTFLKNQTDEIKTETKEEGDDSIKQEISSGSEVENDTSIKDEVKIENASDSDESNSVSDGDSDSKMDDDAKSQDSSENGNDSDDEGGSESDDDNDDGSESDEDKEGSEFDDDNDERSESDDNSNDEDVKPDVSKMKRKKSNDVLEGRTVFIKNVPFMATEEELEAAVKQFGPIFYAKICLDLMTEHSKGTAFVKFKTKESADACLSAGTEFTLNSTVLDPHPALPKRDVQKKQNQPKGPADSRNLYLLKEGVVMAGSMAATGVSAPDMAKRLQIERWKRQIIKDLGKFVSRNRIVIHNVPPYYDDKKVSTLVKKYCPQNARFREVRVMRDLKNVDGKGVGRSKGFAFVSFDKHEDALTTLRTLNNNPSVFKPQKRPIVSFSVESRKALNVKEKRLERSRQPKQTETSEPVIKTEKEGKKGRKKANVEKKPVVNVDSKEKIVKDNTRTEEDTGKERFSGAFATPGSRKFINNLSVKRQALLHRKNMRKEKSKTKVRNRKLPRPVRKAMKMENMTRPKNPNRDDKNFTKLIDKYRAQMNDSTNRKKWFE